MKRMKNMKGHKYAATEIAEYTEIITYPESGAFGVFGGLVPSFPRRRESRPRDRGMIGFIKTGTLHIIQAGPGVSCNSLT